MKLLRSAIIPARSNVTIATCVALLFLVLLPLANALEIHHIFAEVDHDGHNHSEFDLCEWVQAHGTGSVDSTVAETGTLLQVSFLKWHLPEIFLSTRTCLSYKSRGPPPFR